MVDYTAFAETVTDKMLSSKMVIAWGDTRPKLIVATPRNNTDNESIRMQDVHDRISETILNSGVARLMDISSTDFDYVVRTELSSTRQLAPVYKLRLKFSFFPAQPLTRQHVMCFGARITLPHCDVNHFDRSLNPHATPLFTPYYIY